MVVAGAVVAALLDSPPAAVGDLLAYRPAAVVPALLGSPPAAEELGWSSVLHVLALQEELARLRTMKVLLA